MPTQEWTSIQLTQFEQLRKELSILRIRYGIVKDMTLPEDDLRGFCIDNPPLLKTLLSLGQNQLELLLESLLDWMQAEENLRLDAEHYWLGQWIYATLAALMTPLEPNLHHLIREVARVCIKRRSEIKCGAQVLPLNVLICIVSVHFKQSDLGKPTV